MKNSSLLLIVICFFLGLSPTQAQASIFKYTDHNGKEHYTDLLESVPAEYRGSAVNMDEHLQKNPGFMVEPPKPKVPLSDKLKYKTMGFITFWKEAVKTPWERTWMRTMLILVICILPFIFAGKVAKSLGNKHLSSVIRISLTTIILVYFFHNYVTRIANDFVAVKRNILQVKEKADQRNREMDSLIKTIVGEENIKGTFPKITHP